MRLNKCTRSVHIVTYMTEITNLFIHVDKIGQALHLCNDSYKNAEFNDQESINL